MPKNEKVLATAPDLDGIKEQIARYWCAEPDDIRLTAVSDAGEHTVEGEYLISNNGRISKGFYVIPHHRGGFKFVHRGD